MVMLWKDWPLNQRLAVLKAILMGCWEEDQGLMLAVTSGSPEEIRVAMANMLGSIRDDELVRGFRDVDLLLFGRDLREVNQDLKVPADLKGLPELIAEMVLVRQQAPTPAVRQYIYPTSLLPTQLAEGLIAFERADLFNGVVNHFRGLGERVFWRDIIHPVIIFNPTEGDVGKGEAIG